MTEGPAERSAERGAPRARRRLPLLILGITAVLLVVLVLTRPALEPVAQPERVWPVEVVELHRQSLTPELSLFGQVVAGRQSELRALVAGPIVAVGTNFREGGRVAAGELLVQVDPFDYETAVREARALLRDAEAALRQQERDLDRIRELFREDNVSQRDLDTAEYTLEQRSVQVEQRRLELERAERNLRDTRLTAPYAGVVGNISADLGKQIGINDKVADLVDTGRLEVRFSLSNAQYGRLTTGEERLPGRAVTVVWTVGERQERFPATVERVGSSITSTTGGVDVYAALAESGPDMPLRPGAFVSVLVPDRRYDDVFVAPEAALYGEDTVYVVAEAEGVERLAVRRIEVLGHSGNRVIFRSAGESGIDDGDRVVVTQLREAGAGVKVLPQPAGG